MKLGTFGRLLVGVRISDRIRRRRLPELAGVRIRIAWLPDAGDLRRGATLRNRGYFYGVAPEPAHVGGVELPDPTRPEGELVVFLGHPAHESELELERTFEHELGHLVGRSEDELVAMGLGS